MSHSEAITDPRAPAVTPGLRRPPVLKALTSVRFFAALHVALYHLVRPFARWGAFTAAMSLGYSGVSFFFFFLSGFILAYAHAAEYEAGRGNARKFWLARFARVYPVYLLSLLIAAIVSFDAFRQHIHIVAYVADIFLLQSWSMRMINFFNANGWTLSCEAFFYLVFPFVFMALRPRTRGRAIGWVALFYALSIAAPMVCLALFPQAAWVETDARLPGDGWVFLVNRLPLLALPEFLAGVSVGWLFLLYKPTEKNGSRMATLAVVALALAIFFGDRLPYAALHNGLLIPIYTLLLIGLGQPNWLTRLLSGSTLILLGEASYSLYLIHSMEFNVAKRAGFFDTNLKLGINLVASIVIAILLHIYVERPARRFILDRWARRHPSQLRTTA